MRANAHEERISIVGLDSEAQLARPLDASGNPIAFEGRGVVISPALAVHLGVRPGDSVEMEISDGRRPTAILPVTAIAGDYAGSIAYIARSALNRMMDDGDLASGADLLVATDKRADFYRSLASAPQVVSAASRDDTVASFRSAVSAALIIEMGFFLGFACAIGFGVAYNIIRIALADRARDLATLRVLGFSPTECAYILCAELGLLALVAMPVGALGGIAMAR